MNGRAHFTANCIILLGTFGIVATQRPDILEPAMLGSMLGTITTPDYDFKNIYIKSVLRKVPVFGDLWVAYWWPYAVLFKHRKLSHNWLFGTLTRFIYLFLPLVYILYIYNINIYNILILLSFWYIQDFSHYILDLRFFSKSED